MKLKVIKSDEKQTVTCPVCKQVLMSDDMKHPKICKHVEAWYNNILEDWCFIKPKAKKMISSISNYMDLGEEECLSRIYSPEKNFIIQRYDGGYVGGCMSLRETIVFQK